MAAPGPAKITITAKVGPGNTVTTLVLTNVTSYSFNALTNVLSVNSDQGLQHYDVNGVTGWTTTITSGVQVLSLT